MCDQCVCTGESGRQVTNDATTGYEVHVEHHGGVVVGDMRLSVACTAAEAEFQNRIIIRDHTVNLSPSWRGSPTPTLTTCRTRNCARP